MLILSLSVVSAQDNFQPDDLEINENLTDDYNYSVSISDVYSDTTIGTIEVENMPHDASGNISIFVDDNEAYNERVSLGGNCLILNELNLQDGTHSALIKYSGDDKYMGFEKQGKFEKNFLRMSYVGKDYGDEVLLRSSDSPIFYVIVDYGTTGKLYVTVDDNLVLSKKLDGEETSYGVYVKNLQYGTHTYKITYKDGNHKKQVKTGSINVTYYFLVSPDTNDITIGDEVEFVVSFVEDAKLSYDVTVNGKTKTYKKEIITLSDFELGENIVEFSAVQKSVIKKIPIKINVSPVINVPNTVYYQNGDGITLIVDNNTKGIMNIKIDGKDYRTVDVNGSKTTVSLDGLALGKHSLLINYTGDHADLFGVKNYTFDVIPYIPTVFSVNELNNLTFIASEEINGNLKVTGMINENVEAINGSATIPLGKIGAGTYVLNIAYENTNWRYIILIHESSDWDMELYYIPRVHGYEWKIQYDDRDFHSIKILNAPDGLKGSFKFYEDGKYLFTRNIVPSKDYDYEYLKNPKYDQPGTHTITVVYSGDDYFKPCNKTITYFVTDLMDIDYEYETFYVLLPYDATGAIAVYVNGNKLGSKKLVVGEDDFEYGIKYHGFDGSGFKKGKTYDIKVVYKGNYGEKTFKTKFKIDLDLEITSISSVYGEESFIKFKVTPGTKNKVIVKFDGVEFDYDDDDGYIIFLKPKLKPGIHNITLYYPGDSKFPSKTVTKIFETTAELSCPTSGVYDFGSTLEVSINLPADATGNLVVEINGTLYNSTPLNKGKATIRLPSQIGEYNYFTYYDGNYRIPSYNATITIGPKIKHSGNSYYPDEGKITVKLGGDYNASMVIFAEYYPIAQVDFKNKITFIVDDELLNKTKAIVKTLASNGDFDEYSVTLEFMAVIYVDGEAVRSTSWYTTYLRHFEASNLEMTYDDGSIYTIKAYDLLGNPAIGEKVTVKIGSNKYDVYTNSKGVASLKIKLAPNKYPISVTYCGRVLDKYITVKHTLTLAKVNVKKSAKKLVLAAKISKKVKGKKIVFKFGSYKYVGYTNKKGVAKVIVKAKVLNKLKVGKNVKYKAAYGKDIITLYAKVKR